MIDITAHNRQLASAMLVAQKEIFNAGFGLIDADTDDITIEYTTATASTPATQAILWRLNGGTQASCRGLRENSITINSTEYRILSLVESASDCNYTAPLTDLNWDSVVGILGQWPVVDTLADYLAENQTLFSFTITIDSCSPYGMMPLDTHLTATVSAPTTAELNNAALPKNALTICLFNTIAS